MLSIQPISKPIAMIFPQLSNLLHEVHEIHRQNGSGISRVKTLQDVLTKKHYWPYLQIKYFGNESSLVLLHNVYRQEVPIDNKELYDECRSVVLNMDANEGENIILSLSKKIPIRHTVESYQAANLNDIQRIELGYEGTMLYMYHYQDRWHISTSTCPSVDRSRYFHPTKSHGDMLNEALIHYFPNEVTNEGDTARVFYQRLRDKFFGYLDTSKTYRFLLVHHENGYLMNYTSIFGENYRRLVQMGTMDQNQNDCMDQDQALHALGIFSPIEFETIDGAFEYLQSDPCAYAIMIHTPSNLYKVCRTDIYQKEHQETGHPNPWMNLLWVYMKSGVGPTPYKMEDYIREHPSEAWTVVTDQNHVISAPRVIAKVMTCMRDMLYAMYRSTTYYFSHTNSYRITSELDQALPRIHRFHLAQLRHIQITYHAGKPLTRPVIHQYLCQYQTIKNIRLLMKSFMTDDHRVCFDPLQWQCFQILSNKLRRNVPIENAS